MRSVFALLILLLAAPAYAGPNFAPLSGEEAKAPIGWVEFCELYPADCKPTSGPYQVSFTPERWQQMVSINRSVNASIIPMGDLEHWGKLERWDYAEDGFGDCDEYVLVKRKELSRMGWPLSALLIVVVRDKNNEGHAVLMARTDLGDFILDNQSPAVLVWSDTTFRRYVKRQSSEDPNRWVSFAEDPQVIGSLKSK